MFSTVILMSFLWSTCSIKERPTFPTSTPTVSCCYSNSEKHRSKSWLEARALSAMSMTLQTWTGQPHNSFLCMCVPTYWSRNQNPRLSTLETLKRTTRRSSSRVERLWSRELLGPINLSRVMTRYWLYIWFYNHSQEMKLHLTCHQKPNCSIMLPSY